MKILINKRNAIEMGKSKKNEIEEALKALEKSMRLLEEMSRGKSNTGACVWISTSGKAFCAQLTPEDCKKVSGATFIGGTCK